MPTYSDIIPLHLLEAKFGKVERKVIAKSKSKFLKALPSQVPGICMFIWDEMVDRGLVENPYKIGQVIHNDYRGIYEFVRRELGREAIEDAYAEKFFNEIDPKESFVDLSVAHCFPDDLHIIDIELSDNSQPLKKDHPSRTFRQYHGLHMFGDVLDKIKEVARNKGLSRISLMVAHPPLHKVFSRYGFKVGKSVMARAAFNQVGSGHSMYLKV